jgi:hypothetical protein
MRRRGVRGLVDFGRRKGRSLGREFLLLGAIWSTLLLVGCEPHPCPRVAAPRPQPCPSTMPPPPAASRSWIVASESTVPSKDWRIRSHAGTTACLADVGCPFQPAAIPVCPPTTETDNWQSAPDGSTVILRGRLQAIPGPETQEKCGEANPCCNTVFGRLILRVGSLAVALFDAPGRVDFVCDGDITMLCCGFDSVGSEVLVRGTIERGPTEPRRGSDGNTVLTTVVPSALCRVESDQER